MGQHGGEAFVGLDVSKLHNAAIADQGRNGEIRFSGEIPNTPEATRKLVTKLTAKYDRLHFCYRLDRPVTGFIDVWSSWVRTVSSLRPRQCPAGSATG